jgi:hypothetical protein
MADLFELKFLALERELQAKEEKMERLRLQIQ